MTTETNNGEADAGYWMNNHSVQLKKTKRVESLLREALPHLPADLAKRVRAELEGECDE